jgi:hypothetical protein
MEGTILPAQTEHQGSIETLDVDRVGDRRCESSDRARHPGGGRVRATCLFSARRVVDEDLAGAGRWTNGNPPVERVGLECERVLRVSPLGLTRALDQHFLVEDGCQRGREIESGEPGMQWIVDVARRLHRFVTRLTPASRWSGRRERAQEDPILNERRSARHGLGGAGCESEHLLRLPRRLRLDVARGRKENRARLAVDRHRRHRLRLALQQNVAAHGFAGFRLGRGVT